MRLREWAGSSPTSLGGPAKMHEEETWGAVAATGSWFTSVCANYPAKTRLRCWDLILKPLMGTIDRFHFPDVKIKSQRELTQGQIVLNRVKLWDLFEPWSSCPRKNLLLLILLPAPFHPLSSADFRETSSETPLERPTTAGDWFPYLCAFYSPPQHSVWWCHLVASLCREP